VEVARTMFIYVNDDTNTQKTGQRDVSKSKIKNKTGQPVIIFGTLQVLHSKTHLGLRSGQTEVVWENYLF
jgi:hypothetical protein